MGNQKLSAIVVSGGKGTRMGAELPKQYLKLAGAPMATYSVELFLSMEIFHEVIVVCDPAYQHLFPNHPKLRFTSPGKERQDSVFNGMQACSSETEFFCIHDAARPFITESVIRKVVDEASIHGAAVVAVPMKSTVKKAKANDFVDETLDRSLLWEIQTPQVIRKALLVEGYEKVRRENLAVTDDVSIVEQLGSGIKLVRGEYQNIKITTPEDLSYAQFYVKEGMWKAPTLTTIS